MRINHNLASLSAYKQLTQNNFSVSKSIEKLSSGLRINHAADDAAGLAISEKMKAQIRGLDQAERNVQDGISLIQTAEGGASNIHDMMQRIRELSVQAANDTLTDADRSEIQKEIDQNISQIDAVANNTQFNKKNLLNKTGLGVSQDGLNQLTENLPGWINDALVAINSQLGIAYPDSPVNRPMTIQYYSDSTSTTGASMGTSDGSSLTLRINTAQFFDSSGNLKSEGVLDSLIAHEMVHALEFTEMPFSIDGADNDKEQWFLEGLAMTIQGGNGFLPSDNNVSLGSTFDGDYGSAYEAVKVMHELIDGGISALIDRLEAGEDLDTAIGNVTFDTAGTEIGVADAAAGHTVADITDANSFINYFNNSSDVAAYLASSTDFTQGTGAITTGNVKGSSSNLSTDDNITNGTGTAQVDTYYSVSFDESTSDTDSSIRFQVGANAGQYISLQTRDLRSAGLGLRDLSVETIESATDAINTIDAAIESVSSARNYFGAMQNRLEHTIANLNNSSKNLTASESRIRDVDMAKEMMKFAKKNILVQAAQTMMVQANQQTQGILKLLG